METANEKENCEGINEEWKEIRWPLMQTESKQLELKEADI